MRVVTYHSPHERCGIAEYGRQLDAALAVLGADVAPRTFATEGVPDVAPGTVVLVHFEPSLVPPNFLSVLQEARLRGARVVLCCHWYAPTAFSALALRTVDRFVLHRRYDGATHPKFAEVPLGCPVYDPLEDKRVLRERLNLPQDRTVLTTVGFLTRWKRMPEVLAALFDRVRLEDVFLQILAPKPFVDEGSSEEDAVRELLRRQDGRSAYLFSTKFLPEEELLDRVRASDLGFVYHGQHTGSVSAATKQFVSTRTPLVATPSSHASDIRGVVRAPSFDAGAFAEEVLRTAGDRARLAALRDEMEGEYQRINMRAVAARYLELFGSLLP